ncbi:MAG: histidine--tRNA ligase [Candidatus Marinimicrobia bacterium]|nr:histidine--tRNA ligase [Candidatus Neomarinimicrobiota bacterium]
MSKLQPVRGTHDLLFEETAKHRLIESVSLGVAERFGFREIATPIFEFTDVFSRTLGETSDVVTKEMYTFETKGGESITLRPEGTAGIARAFISGGLAQQTPLKIFYRGPMFRHERPQKGRQRQFHQIGVELIGVAGPQADIEVISLASHILADLNLQGNVTLEINSLGDSETRAFYRDALFEYLSTRKDNLSTESQERLSRNPLRILDSKDPDDRKVLIDAPDLSDYLSKESQEFFAAVREGLAHRGISFLINSSLVRGLDYYGHTAFEFTTDAIGAQGTVLAGGRYDSLIEHMGGPPTPGIGWAAGIERLAMLLPSEMEPRRIIAAIPMSNDQELLVQSLANTLRKAGYIVDIGYSGNVGKRMKRADKIKAAVAIVVGSDEVKNESVVVRNLQSGDQQVVKQADLVQHFSFLK